MNERDYKDGQYLVMTDTDKGLSAQLFDTLADAVIYAIQAADEPFIVRYVSVEHIDARVRQEALIATGYINEDEDEGAPTAPEPDDERDGEINEDRRSR